MFNPKFKLIETVPESIQLWEHRVPQDGSIVPSVLYQVANRRCDHLLSLL